LEQDNEYVLISEKPAWQLIEKWVQTNPLEIKRLFMEAAGFKQESPYELVDKRKTVTTKSLGLSYKEPIVMVSSLFQYMFNDKGNTYLDAYNNIPHVGHCHPKISQAITTQIRNLNTNTRYLYKSFTDYSEKLLNYFPPKLCKVFFVNSGSEANDLAVRMSRAFTNRNKIVILEHGYHGNTSLCVKISSYKFDGKGGKGLSGNIIKLPLPKKQAASIKRLHILKHIVKNFSSFKFLLVAKCV
jgi:ethanolamine-phosphate phospho-lyase